ncbi:MAG: short-chain fatty acid transporter, partial [Gammaproteobacteria bacterium]|nr:short-chain fatty acid transporter [Gammaproteobacteria bacterium]
MTDPQKKQSWFYRFNLIIEKYSPDAFVFAVLLTIVVLILSQVATDTSLEASVIAWGNGLHGLMAFSFQMAFIICAAFVLAHTTAVSKLLSMLGSLPQSTNQAYILVILCTAMFSLLIWPMGLIAGGLISKEVARNASNRNISVHYPLLIAAAFGGFIVWHMGYSSSIGLAIATQGNPLEQQIGEIIPVTETLLTWWNILTIFITLAVVSVTIILLHPKKSIELPSTSENQSISNEIPVDRRPGIMGLLEHSRITSTILSIMLFAYIGLTFYKNGLDLNLNVV